MVAFMVFVTGASVALAFFYLIKGLIGFSPEFNRETLDEIGMLAAFGIFCCAGPVMLVRALDQVQPASMARSLRNTVVFTFLILTWTASIGILAVESARTVL